MRTGRLSFFESVMLVSGAGIGTGILTIPYAVAEIGIWGTLISLAFAYAASAVLYLMIADLSLHSDRSSDLISILDRHLFRGRKGPKTAFFVILTLLILENLVVYIMTASDVITDLLPLSAPVSKLLFWTAATVVILFGVRGLGIGEKVSVVLISAVVTALTVLSLFHRHRHLDMTFGKPGLIFAVYGLFMFTFSAIFSVVQVCGYIEKPEKAGKAVVCGLTVNAAVTLTFTLAVILGSVDVTPVATIGLCEGIGLPALRPVCAVFVLCAMLSSFWSSGLALTDVLTLQTHIPRRLSWLIGTIPALLASVLLPLGIMDYVQLGAGALSVILILVVIPAYRNAVKTNERPPLLGRAAKNPILLGAVCAAVCLMAVSSLIPIP